MVRGSSCLTTHHGELRGLGLAEQEGFEPSIRYNRIPDFESGAFDHSAIAPEYLVEPWILSEPQGFLGEITGALRGAMVSMTRPLPINPPSIISMVAVRSWRVSTSRLLLPRTAETTVQPCAG